MRRKKYGALYALVGVLLLSACGAEPASQTTATEQTEPRLVATTTALADIFAELNLELVGVPETAEELDPMYDGVPTVGNAMDPDEEIILSLKPTEVFSVTSLQSTLQEGFDAVGLQSNFVDLQGIDNMYTAIENIGAKYDREKEAQALITSIEEPIEELAATIVNEEKPTVLILLGIPGSYLVASENSYVGSLLARAGGVNVVQGDNQPEYLASNTEFLHQGNPDIILRLAHGWPEKVVEMFEEEFKTNDIWKHFNAVKTGRVYDLDEPQFGTTANLHVNDAFEQLVEIMYGS